MDYDDFDNNAVIEPQVSSSNPTSASSIISNVHMGSEPSSSQPSSASFPSPDLESDVHVVQLTSILSGLPSRLGFSRGGAKTQKKAQSTVCSFRVCELFVRCRILLGPEGSERILLMIWQCIGPRFQRFTYMSPMRAVALRRWWRVGDQSFVGLFSIRERMNSPDPCTCAARRAPPASASGPSAS